MPINFVVASNLACHVCYRLQTLQALVIMCTTYFNMQSLFRSQQIKVILFTSLATSRLSFSHRNRICRTKCRLIEFPTSKLSTLFFSIFPSYISSFTFEHICTILFSYARILTRSIDFVPTGYTHIPEE
jgi:hypothetical protein